MGRGGLCDGAPSFSCLFLTNRAPRTYTHPTQAEAINRSGGGGLLTGLMEEVRVCVVCSVCVCMGVCVRERGRYNKACLCLTLLINPPPPPPPPPHTHKKRSTPSPLTSLVSKTNSNLRCLSTPPSNPSSSTSPRTSSPRTSPLDHSPACHVLPQGYHYRHL